MTDRDKIHYEAVRRVGNGMKGACFEIGAVMNRERSTVSYYLRKYDEEYKYNPEFRELADWFNQIKEQI